MWLCMFDSEKKSESTGERKGSESGKKTHEFASNQSIGWVIESQTYAEKKRDVQKKWKRKINVAFFMRSSHALLFPAVYKFQSI